MSAELHLRRIIAAPRALVWDCWTRPELVQQWFCPRPHRLTEVHIDLRPGGRFEFGMLVDGASHYYRDSYLEVAPQSKLVFTDLMTENWTPAAKPFLAYTAEVTLADHAEGTEYRVLARHRTPEEAARHDEMGFTEGWGTCADQLDELARTGAAA